MKPAFADAGLSSRRIQYGQRRSADTKKYAKAGIEMQEGMQLENAVEWRFPRR